MPRRGATPIIHIGFPKAASTWFQKSFFPHVRSPRYVDRAKVNAALLEANALTFDPDEALAIMGLARGEAGILSEEGLCGYQHNGGIDGIVTKEFAHRIKAAFPDGRIVIMLRSQPSIIVSLYQQYIRAGGTYGPRRYLFPKQHLGRPEVVTYKQPRFDVDFFLYSRIVALYDELFGRENVHVFLFEEFRRDGLEFLHRFADALQLDVDWTQVSLDPRLAGYGAPLALIARGLNLFTRRSVLDKRHILNIPGWYRPRRKLLEGLNRTGLFGKPPTLKGLLGEASARELEMHFARDNAVLAERRGLPLREMGYPMPEPQADSSAFKPSAVEMAE